MLLRTVGGVVCINRAGSLAFLSQFLRSGLAIRLPNFMACDDIEAHRHFLYDIDGTKYLLCGMFCLFQCLTIFVR